MVARKISQAADLIAAQRADNERLREDAERYRWLFADTGNSVTARVNEVYRMWDGQSDWHAAIDAAMKEGK